MESLSVRRSRSFAMQHFEKLERTAGPVKTTRTAGKQQADTVSETLEKLLGRMDQVGRQVREGRRTLHQGEAALTEVEDALERMEELARQAVQDKNADRGVLQSDLEQLQKEIRRIIQEGVKAGLFLEEEGPEDAGDLTQVLPELPEAGQGGVRDLPRWLVKAMAGNVPDRAALLSALGVSGTAGGAELLEALSKLSLEDSDAAGYLAGLYLGAVISGGIPTGEIDPERAAQGLEQLLKLISQGTDPDEAVELLTGGLFTGLADFQEQFIEGLAPGLEDFLTGLLTPQVPGEDQLASLAALLAGGGEGEVDLLMDLLLVLDGAGAELELPRAAGEQGQTEPELAQAAPARTWAEFGAVRVSGELSGVRFEPESGVLTVDGGANLILRGQDGEVAVRFTGEFSGKAAAIQQLRGSLSVQSTQVQINAAGENRLSQVLLGEGSVLTLGGGGLTRIGVLRSMGEGSTLRLTGGMVELLEAQSGPGTPAPVVVVDGPVSLLVGNGIVVRDPQGETLMPLDILWKTMLPGWSALTSLMVDGKQGQLVRTAEDHPDPIRLWLQRGNENQGFPAHSIVLQGRNQAGQARVHYVYVRWDQRTRSFQEITMYPNPFTVIGGEEGTDWRYEEACQTLRILSGQVSALSGGMGKDGDELPFSGRLVLEDGVGQVELTLEGVECRVSAGRAFNLGKKNSVKLLLQAGSENIFESGPGFAGISLGAGTSLTISAKYAKGEPEGKLTAKGGSGGAGIGRDSGTGRERTGTILIRGGFVSAAGTGGGAGIGGGLSAAAGDICIQGGVVSARATQGAAAIGAGVQGACGDIIIAGSARVAQTKGGGKDGDIGGCLFGNCGRLQVSPGADLGGAKLWDRQGISLQVGETSLTMPKLRISDRALRLYGMDLSTREAAQAALSVLNADRCWVRQFRGTYGVMYGQLSQSVSGLYSAQQYVGVVREKSVADLLLRDARQTLRQDPMAPYRLRELEHAGELFR